MANKVLIPLGMLAAAGAFFAKKNNDARIEEGSVDQGFFSGIMNALKSIGTTATPQPEPDNTPPGPLPLNIPLNIKQVERLADGIIRANAFMTTTKELVITAYIESTFRPWVFRNERNKAGAVWDTSYGLMQTLVGTASDMYNRGYTAAGKPTPEALKTPETSMYFGAAYKDWLRRTYKGKSDEWYVRAYNGGPGWERTQNGPANTGTYLNRYKSAAQFLYGGPF